MNKIYLGIDGKIELLLISVNVDKIKKDLNNWIKIMNGRKKLSFISLLMLLKANSTFE